MKTIRFGRTDATVSPVSLGTWGYSGPRTVRDGVPVGWSGHDDDLAVQAIRTAWDAGINHWDTADVYGDGRSERLIGTVWSDVPRDRIFLASKVGWDPGPSGHYYEPSHMRGKLELSLRNLQTDVIDLYYFHHCDFGDDDQFFEAALETMQKFRDEGKIRFIGLSDWNSAKIMKFIERVDPDVVQPYRNLVDDSWESSGLAGWAREHDLGVAFFSPLKHGLLLGKYDQPATFPEGDFRSRIPEFSDPRFIARMKMAKAKMEERFSDRPEPVLHAVVGALLTGVPNSCVLLGQRNPKQAEAAGKVGEALSPEDADWVRRVYRGEE